ncbi:metal ABC transporter permease [Georgenia satyanarayanai]|uniref:metal ABC transporter permease n=1 Tax=Georgenia satyanarayanai TaxID=860221 RepID=UPI00203ADC05|nr:metal ABC transporter permease [Georgenia satyanarayanai]MCM3661607.1 metal ABC transporter permease [Georgenia satyanarayanai]
MSVDVVIIVTALLVVAPCALLGCFLLLRRSVMVGDAISHAALPGIVLAFLLTGSLGPLAAVAGAAAFGLLTVVLVDLLERGGKVRGDAATGIVFTGLFALGVLLVARYGGNVHLDLEHVLFGEIAFAPLHVLTVGGVDLGPRSWWTTGTVAVLAVAVVALLYKELKVTTFDPALAAVVGISPVLVHHVLMALVSVTVVGAFDSVGAILVVALLAGPAATAYLLTDRLGLMLVTAFGVGAVAVLGGYGLAVVWDLSIAGMIASAVGAAFLLALLAAPRHGLVGAAVLRRRRRTVLRRRLVAHAARALGEAATTAQLAARLQWPVSQVERVRARLD